MTPPKLFYRSARSPAVLKAFWLGHATSRAASCRRREKPNGKTKRIYEKKPSTPYQRLLESPDIPERTKTRLHVEHAALDPFVLEKNIEAKLRKFFTALGNIDRGSTKTRRSPPASSDL